MSWRWFGRHLLLNIYKLYKLCSHINPNLCLLENKGFFTILFCKLSIKGFNYYFISSFKVFSILYLSQCRIHNTTCHKRKKSSQTNQVWIKNWKSRSIKSKVWWSSSSKMIKNVQPISSTMKIILWAIYCAQFSQDIQM